MKTIEEGAKEFVNSPCDWLCANCATDKMSCRFYNDKESFKAGAEWRGKELTRWHDPEVDVPEDGQRILLKATNGQKERIYLGYMYEGLWEADGGFVFIDDAQRVLGFDGVVIGWREIHE